MTNVDEDPLEVLEKPTADEIAQHYSAMLDSVSLINEIVASGRTDNGSVDEMTRNKEHLKIMLAESFWTNEDMSSVNLAINA